MKQTNSPIINIYFFSIVLAMLKSMKICWLWSLPQPFFVYFAFLMTIVALFSTSIFKLNNKKNTRLILFVYLLMVLVQVFFGPPSNIFGYLFSLLIHPILLIGVLLLKDEYKIKLFDFFVKIFSFILIVSIPAWILYLMGRPFHQSPLYDVGDGFHYMYSYTFFVISYNSVGAAFPRFASIFLEPGWVGTLCCFVLFGIQFNRKRLATYLCFIGILLSMSLSAFVNLIVCGVLWIVMSSKHKFVYALSVTAILAGVALFALKYNNGNNALNERIMERLVFDEDLGIAGNNRTNETLDYYLEDMLSSSNRWFGFSNQIDGDFSESNDWYSHASGIKKSLITNGIVGVCLLLAFFTLLLFKYRCKKSFVFYVCFLMASFIRDLWQTDCYIILYITAMAVLYTCSMQESNRLIGVNGAPKKY